MNKYALLLVPFLANTPQLVAGLVATSVTASTHVLPSLEWSCSNSSIGTSSASASCGSSSNGIPLVDAEGFANVSLGSLSLLAHISAEGQGEGYVTMTAQYDSLITFPEAVSGPITGQYHFSGSSTSDQQDQFPRWGAFIGQGGSSLDIPPSGNTGFLTETVALTSSYTAGQTLDVTGSASGWAGNSYGSYNTHVSLQLIGFFDQAGNPLTYTEVPEPVLWPLLFVSLGAICALRPTGRT